MFLKKIKLQNFRNYSDCDFEFKTPITVLLGNNAQGKSNFLESIYFLSTTKSPKADRDEELIKKGEQVLRLEGEVSPAELGKTQQASEPESQRDQSSGIKLEITMVSDENGFSKRVKVNGVARRVLDYIGNLSAVTFTPEDINLVTGSPSLRRWHVDLTLAQIDKSYKMALTNYGDVVIRKNRLLKMVREGEARPDELTFWSNQQLEFGEIIQRKRRMFFEFVNNSERNFGQFEFEYLESILTKERLEEYQSREIAAAASLVGPHRDDFKFIEGRSGESRDLAKYGSRGEHRTAILDLKLTEVSFIETVLGSRPVLLLDDVFSELDKEHQRHVIELAGLQQTIIAGVELDREVKGGLKNANFFQVQNGVITDLP